MQSSARWAPAGLRRPGEGVPAGWVRPGAGLQGDGPVTYLWGIPFCPAGLDRDLYSRAIVCQLQVYERCLKRTQSLSLCKAAFGPPVLPRPGLPWSGPASHSTRQLEQPEAQAGGQHGEKPGKTVLEAADKVTSPGCSDKPEVCPDVGSGWLQGSVVCPEDALDDGGGGNSGQSEEEQSEDSRDTGSRDVRPEDEVLFIGTETQQSLSENMQPESEAPRGPNKGTAQEAEDVVLIEDEAEEFPTISPAKKFPVECPICGQQFPLEKIEMHAADCNGACDEGREQKGITIIIALEKDSGKEWISTACFNTSIKVQTRSHTRRVVKQNSTAGSKTSTPRPGESHGHDPVRVACREVFEFGGNGVLDHEAYTG
ncbi:BRCA1-A complex subunit RAP80 isoform X3 [Narcine bancroftii]|uniref:BRCA1-A complex subunit RAP80 isoform X3 n=1 Tax=Narcine bancroftii TaxID=1343680 RepID=UPI003831C44D